MKNTKKSGRLRFLIYGRKNHYIGICLDLGLVEEGKSAEYVKQRLLNGTKAILISVIKNNLSNDALNVRPPLKYRLAYHFMPLIATLYKIQNLYRFNARLPSLQAC